MKNFNLMSLETKEQQKKNATLSAPPPQPSATGLFLPLFLVINAALLIAKYIRTQ